MQAQPLHAIVHKALTPELIGHINNVLEKGVHFPYIEKIPKNTYILMRAVQLFKNAAKVYFPVHTLILVLRLIKSKQKKSVLILRAVKEFIKSNLFATAFAMSIPWAYCYLDTVCDHPKSTFPGFIVSFVFSFGILFESSSRWGEMSLWVLAQWFEGFVYSLYKRKYLPVIPHWEKYILLLAMGIIAQCYYDNTAEELEKDKGNKLDVILKFILGSKKLALK